MKLRNKKTGEVGEAYWATFREQGDDLSISLHKNGAFKEIHSLAELNEDWEDAPDEPFIEDAGKREAMRLWAKVNLIPSNAAAIEYSLADTLSGTFSEFWYDRLHIMFYGNIAPHAIHGKVYTIAELCGEEEE